jgi:hypothetical protein
MMIKQKSELSETANIFFLNLFVRATIRGWKGYADKYERRR